MCTDKTFDKWVREYKEAAEAEKVAKAKKAKCAEWLIAELTARGKKKDRGVQIVSRPADYISAKRIKEEFPEVWNRAGGHTDTQTFIRSC